MALAIVGVRIFCLVQVTGWFSGLRLRRRGVCTAAGEWQAELTRLRQRLRISQPIELLGSCFAEAPLVLGHFRPIILMRSGVLAGLPAGQIEAILLHELAHIRRCDYLVNAFQRLVEGLFFYHPAAWWISRIIRTEREDCCDGMAVEMSGDARDYAKAPAALEINAAAVKRPLPQQEGIS